jgi:hypothetical protein
MRRKEPPTTRSRLPCWRRYVSDGRETTSGEEIKPQHPYAGHFYSRINGKWRATFAAMKSDTGSELSHLLDLQSLVDCQRDADIFKELAPWIGIRRKF